MANIKRKSDTTKQTKISKPDSLKSTEASTENDSILQDYGNISDEEGGTRIGDIYIPPPTKPYCSVESKGPRLIITKIENENFKSYAGKVVLGPFHHCFTAIIGPNGSGKSNVIDSMLFVFGYRAQKIRCKKLSVLLHNSAKFPNMQMCSVAVHFKLIIDKDDETCEPVENSEIIIARTAFKDNSSYYTINGKRVQFNEVSKLLKKNGVDLDHNRFLILQGEVESIAMMKAKGQTENECGMLEYLEDIVGTTRYKEPLLKINSRVETLTEERTEKHNRCKLAEREMKDLEQPYNEAIDNLKLENSFTRTKNLHIQKLISNQNKKLQEFSCEHEIVATNLKDHDKQYEHMINERRQKESLFKEEVSKHDEMCKNKEKMEQELKAALNNFTETQTNMALTNKRRKQNKTQLEKHEEKLIELKNMPAKNETEITDCEKKIERLTGQNIDLDTLLQKNLSELEEETKPLIEKREKLETELVGLKKIEDDAKAELTLTEQELRILKHDEISEQRKYESMKGSFEESKIILEEKQLKIKQLKIQIPELKNEIQIKLQQLQQNKNEEETLRNQLINLKADISEKMNNMQTARSNNKVLDSLMQQKNCGKIPGILGRLGDLGGIDAKYDVAISTACGRLDNIIVDTVNTAQACIEHLKQHNVGRASFIALEKVQHLHRYCTSGFNAPENVPRLFDLVRVEDQRILPAFYFSLRNTLVANDLDQGTRIAYGATRYRVVTLQGDVIETSGTMSGGGRQKIKGRMGQNVTTKTVNNPNKSVISDKALEELQFQAENLQSKINYLQEQQGCNEKEIQQLQHSLQSKDAEINKLSITAESLSEQLPRIEKQLNNQQARVKKTTTDPIKVENLEMKIKLKKDEYQKSENAANKLTTKIANINKNINDIHGDKVKSVQNKINNLTKQINTLNANVSKLKVEISSSERTYNKISQEIEVLKVEIKESEEQIRSLNEKRKSYDEEGVECTKKIETIKEEIKLAATNSTNIQKEILDIQKKENEGNLKRIEIEEKLQVLDKKITEVKNQLPHLQNKLKPLKLNEIPGDIEPLEPLKIYTEDELSTYKSQDLQYQWNMQEEKLNEKKTNLSVIQEYTNKREIYLERVQRLEYITNKRNEMRQLYDDVRKKRYTEFMKGFHIITRKLKEMYQMITQGGDAELELVDSMDPFTEGVTFSVRPPKKTWKNISNLSGGEKTLSSLALVFALHYYKPSPLYFMDEIDAALDFKNISIVAHYIKERTKNAQFIIISLRSNMFELSDYIVGIYKVCDCTNTLTIRNYPPVFLKNITTEEDASQNNIEFDNLLNDATETVTNDAAEMIIIASPKINDAAEISIIESPRINPHESLTAVSIQE